MYQRAAIANRQLLYKVFTRQQLTSKHHPSPTLLSSSSRSRNTGNGYRHLLPHPSSPTRRTVHRTTTTTTTPTTGAIARAPYNVTPPSFLPDRRFISSRPSTAMSAATNLPSSSSEVTHPGAAGVAGASTSAAPGTSSSSTSPATATTTTATSTAADTAASSPSLSPSDDTASSASNNTAESSSPPPLLPALPAPPAHAPGEEGSGLTTIEVNGAAVILDNLGPMVVGRDGTVSRIANWHEMAAVERENTLRILGKRNQLRLANLRNQQQQQQQQEDANQNQPSSSS
ncbi:hypothetical protein QBC46DRAFT_374544 [Diplogelasinospora grovesii]|uniref:Uncharacterized protein n=1 Tax=Diplogelasinospora grovesii TaxID=303347 RepID=A0AAN6NEW8_9PEZI|nr:hypothetical protein QBC46DRAFT_374544 [Diplogelasinospora grovesii]